MNLMRQQAVGAFRKSVKGFLRSKGYELYRKHYYDFNGDESLKKIMKNRMSGDAGLTIFDVGANVGQSVDRFYRIFPQARIFSFEPNVIAYNELRKKEKQFPNLRTLNIGLSDKVEKRAFFKQPDSGASSFLRFNSTGEEFVLSNTDKAKLNHNKTTVKEALDYNSEVFLETDTIDSFCTRNSIGRIDLLKIDTQGFEPEVLEGARATLDKISIIECEVILGNTYERACSFYNIESKIRDHGFFLWDIPYIGKFATEEINRINFLDAIYVNKNILAPKV